MAPGDHPDEQRDRQGDQENRVDPVDQLQHEIWEVRFEGEHIVLQTAGGLRCPQEDDGGQAGGQETDKHSDDVAWAA